MKFKITATIDTGPTDLDHLLPENYTVADLIQALGEHDVRLNEMTDISAEPLGS